MSPHNSFASSRPSRLYVEYFCVTIRNKNTRLAYARQVWKFLDWCEARGVTELRDIKPMTVAGYIETFPGSVPSSKQALAAIRKCFDWLTTKGVLEQNPATSVAGEKNSVRKGKTPVLSQEDAQRLISSIDTSTIAGLRDRAFIGALYYGLARASAALEMRRADYFRSGNKWYFRLHEKGGKVHEVPVHHKEHDYMLEYLDSAGIDAPDAPLFPSLDRHGNLTAKPMSRVDSDRMVRRRARRAGIDIRAGNHTWRATGITEFRRAGGALERAQLLAGHADMRTTRLYDRSDQDLTLDDVEKIPSI